MKKILILLTILTTLFSCEKEEKINSDNKQILIEKLKIASINYNNSNKRSQKKNNVIQNSTEYQNLMNASLELIHSYGINDNEIIEDMGDLNSEEIIVGALAISGVETQAANGYDLIDPDDNTSLFTGEPRTIDIASAKSSLTTQSDTFDCLLQACGVTAIMEIMQQGIQNMPKSAVRKLLKKVATRYLGAIGAAVAVYEFGDCMNYWRKNEKI